MKKTITIFVLSFLAFVCFFNKSYAATAPVFDSTFDNNKGALFANGTPITIDEDSSGNTVVTWEGGSQIVPATVSIFGGGTDGTNFESSNITMNGGNLYKIYGGGACLDKNKLSKVGNTNITVNGGTITTSLIGGGLIYAQSDTTNITINDGTIYGVCGGGLANTVISGVEYSAGSEDDLENSKNRVITANVTVNGGTIDSTPSNIGILYGGGQGYSYVGNANLTVNNGDLSKAYVTSGGSNGYTKNAVTTINGGDIMQVQSVNRGIVDSASTLIKGGTIDKVFVGAEVDPQTTGTVNNADLKIIAGKTATLSAGNSNLVPLKIDQKDYKVATVKEAVVNNTIKDPVQNVEYSFEINPKNLNLITGESQKLSAKITTTPTGYENLFDGIKPTWSSSDETVATVDSDGKVSTLKSGNSTITAKFIDKEDSASLVVTDSVTVLFNVLVILALLLTLLAIYLLLNA